MATGTVKAATKSGRKGSGEAGLGKRMMKHWQLYLVMLIPLLLIICFSYIPMYGVQIAFKEFVPTKGIMGSEWVGIKFFTQFFSSYNFQRLLGNTLGISIYSLLAGFPIPIILAVSLNECYSLKLKKSVQMITYAPYFISTVVLVSIMMLLMAPKTGLINNAIDTIGGTRVDFFATPQYFKSLYVWSGVWQGMGFSSVIYIAALSGIDPSLHEAAVIDGATKLQRIWHIDLAGIMPTIVITLILNAGSLMNVGYEKVLLMQNQLNMPTSDVISTYVYRIGLVSRQYSLSTAVGLFNSVVNMVILIVVNAFAKKFSEISLW